MKTITEDKNIQLQIDALDKKMDMILGYVQQQNLQSKMIEDLVSDLSIVGKDAYDSTVAELDKRQVELDPSELTGLAVSFLRNVGNIKTVMDTLEMAVDLGKEVGPIANEVIIDFTKQMNTLEQKGYFDFIREIGPVVDNIVQGFSPQDLKELANSIVSILNIVKEMTQPEVLNTMQNAIKAFNSMETESVPSYSVWKLMREMNSPEMQKALGYGITFMKNVSKDVSIEK
ncbi:DUF1641 domain-containing protein [Lutimonas zeaxanthinifaciens]|uniref:DUF1641 domain-containing protein n=1 Tax=Lutimonas zeaxanthinifaciens TaxID=3060215 RepID=UPI00265CAD91|nr:DUF1641 domain-containing protein [Lutimonas sp. YSD2104]WKK65019.1 DUF1641 domain-containing protein [Lutimonas sp. YSD2104]